MKAKKDAETAYYCVQDGLRSALAAAYMGGGGNLEGAREAIAHAKERVRIGSLLFFACGFHFLAENDELFASMYFQMAQMSVNILQQRIEPAEACGRWFEGVAETKCHNG